MFFNEINKYQLNSELCMMLDYTKMRGDMAEHYVETSAAYKEYFAEIPGQSYRDSFVKTMDAFILTSKKVNVTLWVLQVPIFMLLASFIFMVARQMLEIEQN